MGNDNNNNTCDSRKRNSLICSVTLLFLLLSTRFVEVPAFSPTTQRFQRSITRSTIHTLTLEDRRNIQLFESNKDDENNEININKPILPFEKDSSDGSTNDSTSTGGSTTANGTTAAIDYSKIKPQVVPQRWVQLAYLSLLALLSDWV